MTKLDLASIDLKASEADAEALNEATRIADEAELASLVAADAAADASKAAAAAAQKARDDEEAAALALEAEKAKKAAQARDEHAAEKNDARRRSIIAASLRARAAALLEEADAQEAPPARRAPPEAHRLVAGADRAALDALADALQKKQDADPAHKGTGRELLNGARGRLLAGGGVPGDLALVQFLEACAARWGSL